MDIKEQISIPFMPDGRPCPVVMTPDEVAAFLRLDGSGQRCLKYWRDTNALKAVRIGKKNRYLLSEVMRFLTEKTNKK